MERGESFTVLPGPVEQGQLALVEVGDFLIPGRFFTDTDIPRLELPEMILEIAMPFRVIGPVIWMEDAYNCLN
jgi:hypothetical protein